MPSPYLSVSSCGSTSLRQRGKLAPTPHSTSPSKYKKNKIEETCVLTLRRRSAAEIDELYERKIPAWRWSRTVTAAEEQMHVVVQVKGGVKEGQGRRQVQA